MKKDRVGSIVRQTDGSYKINYKLYFKLKEKQSNYPIKDLVFFDYLNYEDNFTTNSEILKYVKYDQDSIQLFKQKKVSLILPKLIKLNMLLVGRRIKTIM